MRCPSCGTDNLPDSRFCGGCGAPVAQAPHLTPAPVVAATGAKLAPTQKIADDARWDDHAVTHKKPASFPPVVLPPGHVSQPPQMPAPRGAVGPGAQNGTGPVVNALPTLAGPAPMPPSMAQPMVGGAPMRPSQPSRPQPMQAPVAQPVGDSAAGSYSGVPAATPASKAAPTAPVTALPPPDRSARPAPARAKKAGLGGVVIAVLIVDLLLVAAGGVLLWKGLERRGEASGIVRSSG